MNHFSNFIDDRNICLMNSTCDLSIANLLHDGEVRGHTFMTSPKIIDFSDPLSPVCRQAVDLFLASLRKNHRGIIKLRSKLGGPYKLTFD